MKQKVCLLVMTLLFLLGTTPAFAWYYGVGAGSGGASDANGFSLEVGKRDVILFDRPFLVAGAIPMILHGDSHVPSGTHPDPVPHNDFTSMGQENDGTERGLLGKMGMEIKDYDVYVNLLLGLTQANTVDVVRSNPTGEYYIQSQGDEMNAVYGIGFSYFPEFQDGTLKMNFQLDIDNRRGVTGTIGWCW
ncbi:MAG: hypothetical protein KKD44_15780 [Proteobacteria bacterium]|nr:hypothetical protein [Pseudomonadota bacterium]